MKHVDGRRKVPGRMSLLWGSRVRFEKGVYSVYEVS
jgi:hypothetical protein